MKKINWFVLAVVMATLAFTFTGCSGGHHSKSSTAAEDDVAAVDTTVAADPSEDPGVSDTPATVPPEVTPPVVTPKKGFSLVMSSPEAALTSGMARKGLARTGVAVAATPDVDFDMGVIRERRIYTFLLTNNSDKPLTGITVSSSNPKFEASPTTIRSIGAPTQGIGASVLLQVQILHGSTAGGMWAPPVTEADPTTTVSVSGMYGDSAFTVTYTVGVVPAYMSSYTYAVELITGAPDGTLVSFSTLVAATVGHNCPLTYKVRHSQSATVDTIVADTVPGAIGQTIGSSTYGTVYGDCPSLEEATQVSSLSALQARFVLPD